MADPLSGAASIITALDLSAEVLKYLYSVQNASKACKRLRDEVSQVGDLLNTLKNLVNAETFINDSWSATIRSLDEANGPIKQLERILDNLKRKLERKAFATRLKRIARSIQWPFTEREAERLLDKVEQYKSQLSLALEHDHIALSKAIRQDLQALSQTLDDGVRDLHAEMNEGKREVMKLQALQEGRVYHFPTINLEGPALTHQHQLARFESPLTGPWY
jgi:septal ring factor EnvC (AmiA/AmiB activator)